MKKNVFLALMVLCGVLVMGEWCWGQDVAMVVDLQGPVATYESGDKKGQEVMLMDFLAQGDRIKLDQGTVITLNYFASGNREKISGPGTITAGVESSEQEGKVAVKSAVVDYIPPQSDVIASGGTKGGMVVLRGVNPMAKKVRLVFPLNTALRSGPVRLSWRPYRDATGYKIVVTSKTTGVVKKADTEVGCLALNEDETAAGGEYSWKVTAMSDETELASGEGKFFLVDEQEVKQLETTEQYIDKNYAKDSAEARIAKAMLYKKYQLNYDARKVLLGLQKDFPGNRNIAYQIKSLQNNYNR